MKRFYYYPAVLMTTLLLTFSSCSESDTYLNVIPKDAGPVASLNLTSLGEKAGIGDSDNKEAVAKLTEMLKNEMKAASFEKMEAIINNPKKAGVDLRKPIYIFGNDDFFVAATAKVLNKEDLMNTFKMIEAEGNMRSLSEEENGYNLAVVNNKTFAAFNDKTLIMAQYKKIADLEKMKQDAFTLLNQKKEESLASDKGFIKMTETESDMSFYTSFKDMSESYSLLYNEFTGVADASEKSKMISEINFEKGKVDIEAEFYTEDKELKKAIEEKCNYLKSIDNSLLKYFPKSTLGVISIGMDGKKMYDTMMSSNDFKKNFSVNDAEKIGMIMQNLGDEVSIGVVDFSLTQSPSVLIIAEAENGDALKEIYEISKKDKETATDKTKKERNRRYNSSKSEMIELKENEYVIKERKSNYFICYKKNHIYITNNENLYKNIGNSVSPSAEDNSYASAIKGSKYAIAVNMQAIYELPYIKILSEMGGKETKNYIDMVKSIDNIYVKYDDKYNLTIQFVNTKENALKQFGNFAKEFAGIQ